MPTTTTKSTTGAGMSPGTAASILGTVEVVAGAYTGYQIGALAVGMMATAPIAGPLVLAVAVVAAGTEMGMGFMNLERGKEGKAPELGPLRPWGD
jgi:hypothetical protein